MVPVIQAKRNVAVLLDLEYHDVSAQGVNRARRRKTASPGFGVKHASWSATVPFGAPAANRRPKYLVSGQHIRGFLLQPPALPTLRSLGALARWQQVRIHLRGMHLDRKHFTSVEELQQQWESAETPR